MASEFNIKNGFISNNNSIVQGTLTATTIVATTYLNLPYSGSASGTTNYLSKFTGTNSIGDSIVYDNGTNVGIGTNAPNSKLEIKGATSENTTVRISNNGGAFEVPTLQFYRNASVNGSIFYYPDGGTSQGIHIRDSRTDVSNIIFETAGANERMRITSTGYVGIGTTSPSTTLQVSSATNLGVVIGTSVYPNWMGTNGLYVDGSFRANSYLLNSTGGINWGASQARITGYNPSTGSDTYLSFFTGGISANGERIRIIDNGNVGIGTTTPSYKLDVSGTTRLNGLQTFQGTTASDTAPLGSELLTTGTSDTSWTGTSFALGYTHITGSTTTLTSTLAAVNGVFYQITYTIDGRTAGSITINFGGSSTAGITTTSAVGPLATTTGSLVITPTTDFDGTVVLSIKTIGVSVSTTTFLNSNGVVTSEIRNSNSTNNFIGLYSGRKNTTGTANTFLGSNAGQANTTGFQNTFIGNQSGINNTTGTQDTFIGYLTGQQNTGGNQNTFVGYIAGLSNTVGGSNTYMGYASGFNVSSGQANSFYGVNSGRFIADASTPLTNINNSVLIGQQSKPLGNSQTNQIVIGYNSVGLGSNTTVLGNSSTLTTAIYGDLLLGTTTSISSSKLTITSTTQGVLLPRMTTSQINGIVSPVQGLTVFNTDLNTLCFYTTSWQKVTNTAM